MEDRFALAYLEGICLVYRLEQNLHGFLELLHVNVCDSVMGQCHLHVGERARNLGRIDARTNDVHGEWLGVGRWSLVVGRWSLVVGRWSLVVGSW